MSRHASHLLPWSAVVLSALALSAGAQNPPPAKKPMMGPPAPQSTHYPILLLAFGNEPNWSLRIGLKGPERLDRPGYPPIALEPAEVTHEAVADSWTYHAKDSATGAAVAVHLSREACTDALNDTLTSTPSPTGKYAFSATVEHAQVGAMKGCARIATELFPKINNQPDEEEDEDAKKKPPAPTVTNFKNPVTVAFIDSQGRVVMKRGSIAHVVAPDGAPLSAANDGNQLLYGRMDAAKKQAVYVYEFTGGKSNDVSGSDVTEAFWSPDSARIAFLRLADSKRELCIAPVSATALAIPLYSGESLSLQGWVDSRTVLVSDSQQVYWIDDAGNVQSTLAMKDLLGDLSSGTVGINIRVHPLNPDLLLISTQKAVSSGATKTTSGGSGTGILLYEVRSKRRVALGPPDLAAQNAEWSRDGLQILFTGTDSSKRSASYRMFWDGTGLQKYSSGTHMVIGQ